MVSSFLRAEGTGTTCCPCRKDVTQFSWYRECHHTMFMWVEVGSSVLEQRMWNHMMPMQEKVETSFPGIEDGGTMCCLSRKECSLVLLVWKMWNHKVSIWEWVGSCFPGAEDVETMQCLCRMGGEQFFCSRRYLLQ